LTSIDHIIQAWLDGRTERDFLNARALKLVVVLEALRAGTVIQASELQAWVLADDPLGRKWAQGHGLECQSPAPMGRR
jgi:hypothetical protein